jgi:V/A-type H+/Na+-transporting ATPase subunit I
MIIKLSKILIYGLEKEVSNFFEKAQGEGYIEFIGESSKKIKELPTSLKNYLDAINILKKQPVAKFKEDEVKHNIEEVCDRIIQTSNNIDHLEELQRNLEEHAAVIAPFGDFSMGDIEFIKEETNHVFQFFTLKSKKQEKKIPADLIYIGTEYDQDYFVSVNKEKKAYAGYVELAVEMPVGIVRKRISLIKDQLYVQREKLKSYAPYISLLKNRVFQKLNIFNLEIAKKDTSKSLEDKIFSIQAWIPESKLKEFKNFIKDFSIDFSIIAVEKMDSVPTCLENKHLGVLGEDLVKIYDIPATSDKDPSTWVFFSFSLFFAMIIGDAGYGLIFLITALFLKFKLKDPKPIVQRFIKMTTFISVTCIVWGIFTASFFGIDFHPTSPVGKVSVLNYLSEKKAAYHLAQKDDVYHEWEKKYPKAADAKSGKDFLLSITKGEKKKVIYEALETFNRNNLLEISILVGIVHILIAYMRNIKRNFAGIGWSLFLIGGYLFFPSILKATSMVNFLDILPKEEAYIIGKYLIYIGISSAVILAVIQKRVYGLLEITHITNVTGDVLSYLRLYALGLASMILAETFNNLALSMNIFMGFLILLLGHTINLSLGIIGGIIHGLRLNFLEWYNHCFEGGGKLFNPLKLFK